LNAARNLGELQNVARQVAPKMVKLAEDGVFVVVNKALGKVVGNNDGKLGGKHGKINSKSNYLYTEFALGGQKARRLLKNALGNDHDFPVPARAHHIFGVELFKTPLGKKLHKWGIDLNSKQNGVLLPSKHYPGRKAAIHNGRTGGTYNDIILARLREAKTKEQALDILDKLRNELLNGTLKINKA